VTHAPRTILLDRPEVQAADEKRIRDHSLAILVACLPIGCLQTIALSLDALRKEHAHGGLDVHLNMHDGQVRNADVSRRVHWAASKVVRETT